MKLDAEGVSPAFILELEDRFHTIIVSSPVKYESSPGIETIIAFFFIRRFSGRFSIVNIIKTFHTGKVISRAVQTKDVDATEIVREEENVHLVFSSAIQKETGYKINWNTLYLANVGDRAHQIESIRGWGGLNVFGSELLN